MDPSRAFIDASPAERLEATVLVFERHYPCEWLAWGAAEVRRRLQEGFHRATAEGLDDPAAAALFALGRALGKGAAGYDERSLLRSCRRVAAPRAAVAGAPTGLLTLRPAQMQVFERAAKAAARERLLAHLTRVFPERMQPLSRSAGFALVDAGLALAERYGIRDEESVSLLTDLQVAFGPGFEDRDDLQWIGRLLRATSIPGEAKVGMIFRMLAQRGEVTRVER